jgi:hypothetical protein
MSQQGQRTRAAISNAFFCKCISREAIAYILERPALAYVICESSMLWDTLCPSAFPHSFFPSGMSAANGMHLAGTESCFAALKQSF